jgi:MATE family multidrug resistance protein
MGQKELVVKLAIPYYYTLVASTMPFLIFVLLKQIGEGLGNTVMAMSATIAANILHAILNYLLIFGKLGFPRWGLLGAGISTLVTRILMPVLLYFGLKMIASIRIQFDAARDSKVALSKIKSIFAVGLPIAIQLILEVASFSFSAVMMGWLGAVPLASHQVAMGLATFTFMIANSIAMAATIRISFHLGNRSFQAVKITSLAAMRLAIAGMGFCGILFILFRHDLPCIFSRDPNVIKQTAILLGIAGLFQIFDGLQIVCLGILRGFSDVKAPMFISGLSYIAIGLPVSYLCAFAFHKGAAGIWYGFFAGLIAAGIMLSWRIRINILALTTPA